MSAPDVSEARRVVPVSGGKNGVSFFAVSRGLGEKSNKLRVFACCFLKISPSEALRDEKFQFGKQPQMYIILSRQTCFHPKTIVHPC